MVKNFTQKLFMLVFLAGSVSALNAQIELKVTSPASVEGTYSYFAATFGPEITEDFTGTLALAVDALACNDNGMSTITNGADLAGKVAVVDRGTCNFTEKVQNAQAAGAVAVMICNDERPPVNPGGTDPGDITIPSFLVEKADCDAIKVPVSEGTDVVILFERAPCGTVNVPANTLWGADGEGQFDGGPGDWTIANDCADGGWEWRIDGDSQGSFSGGAVIESPSICNGAMVFDSDYLDQNAICAAPTEGSLISPVIDLSNVTIEGLVVQFNQAIRQFQSQYQVLTSYDGGNTWRDTFVINQEFPTNDGTITSDVQRIGLCDVPADAQSLVIRFRYVGNYYFWTIDDILLINEAVADPQTNSNFYAVAPNYATPASQSQEMVFLADVRNNGAVPATNTLLTATVTSEDDGSVLSTTSQTYGTLEGCEQVENILFEDLATTPDVIGSYILNYTISADDNAATSNDSRNARLLVTEDRFAKMALEEDFGQYLSGPDGGVNWGFFGGAPDFTVGNIYHVPNGGGYAASSVQFGIDAARAENSGFYEAHIYQVLPDINEDGNIDPNERVLVGFSETQILTDAVAQRVMELPLTNEDGEPVLLADDSDYLVVVNIDDLRETLEGNVIGMLTRDPDSRNETINNFYYGATELAFDTLAVREGNPQYARRGTSFLNATGDAVEDRILQPFFKTTFMDLIITEVSNTNDFNEAVGFDITPNPAITEAFVNLNLDKVSDNVRVEVMNIAGSVLVANTYNNVQNQQLRINTSDLAAGMYVVRVSTEDGFTTKRLIVGSK